MRRSAFVLLALLAGFAVPATAQPVPALEGALFVGDDTDAGDFLGSCAAAAVVPDAAPEAGLPPAGPLALGGAPGTFPPQAAYLFTRSGGEWMQADRLDADAAGFLGVACALSADGTLAVVGAPVRVAPPASGMYNGAAHVFRYDASTGAWTQEAALRVADLEDSRFFGQAVAVARDGTGTAATEERIITLGGGRAWVLRRSNAPDAVWVEEARFEPEPGDTFQGLTVDGARPHQRASIVHGTDGVWRAMAGGPYSGGSPFRGAAYLWRLDESPGAPGGGAWVQEARFLGGNGACLGHAVALAEVGGVWLAAAGATEGCLGGGVGAGYVRVWRLEGEPGEVGTWVQEAELTLPPGEEGLEQFGYGVALSTGPGGKAVLVASAFLRGGATAPPLGAFVFTRSEGTEPTWRAVAKLSTVTAASPFGSGWAVGVSGSLAVVGHPEEDTAGADAGAVFAFDLAGVLTAAEDAPGVSPVGLAVSVAPNPARGRAVVRFTLAEAGPVRVAVMDVLGRRARSVDLGVRGAGAHTAALDLGGLAPGLYLVRVHTGTATGAARMVLMR
ncbi:MAG: T9SS type A sorting domain-containing protein [Rhodothermales bacterium]